MKLSLRENMEERFKLNAGEWLETELRIETMELKGEDIPKELYEKRWVHWDNIDFILRESVRLGYVPQ
jgi:hypothetical protein